MVSSSKKGKGKKNTGKHKSVMRDELVPLALRRKMADDFNTMCSMFWKMVDNGTIPAQERPGLLHNIIGLCEDAWNVSILAENMNQVSQLLDRNYPASHPARSLVYNMVIYKREHFPVDRAIVRNAQGSFGINGTPAIDFAFDYRLMEEEARSFRKELPKPTDIFDMEALQRVTEGLPPDKVEEALNAELKRQMDVYNNTPQAELGGKTPNEMM